MAKRGEKRAKETAQRARIIGAALGSIKADTVFTGGHLVNVYSGEILPHLWVAFEGSRVVYVGKPYPDLVGEGTDVLDVKGRFLLPGFIDGHTHLDSIHRVRAYAEYALPYGNTTAVTEVSMIANAFGRQGVACFMREAEGLPFKVFVLAPPLVPPFPRLESSRPFSSEDFDELLADDRCLGVGETYWPLVIDGEERALRQYARAAEMGKTREGHAAGARGPKLGAYAAGGATSCHEATDLDEAMERLRLGMAVMVREGYVRRELEAISGIGREAVDLQNVMLVTDLADPAELVAEGGMNLLLRKAVGLGMDPVKAVQMVTVNVARYFRLQDFGGLAPGKVADMVVVEDLEDFRCQEVWADGRQVAADGRLVMEMDDDPYPEETRHSVSCVEIRPEHFQIRTDEDRCRMRVVEVVNETITREGIYEMQPVSGKCGPDMERDILLGAVLNKSQVRPEPGRFLVKGVGLRQGAVATSLIWDTNNVLAIGTSEGEMAAAVTALADMGGGVVVVRDGREMARFPLPLCGVISPEPLPEIVREMGEVEAACRRLGSHLSRPLLTLQTLPFTGLPFLRPTDKGLADIRKGRLVPLFS